MFYSSNNSAKTVQQEGYSIFINVEKKVNAFFVGITVVSVNCPVSHN